MTEKLHMASTFQRTLKTCIPYVGTGLHCGRHVSLLVRPGEVNTGIRVVRKDVPAGEGVVPALWHHVVDTRLGTVIGNQHGVTVATIEHLMAALCGCGIDNAVVELDGPEVPIMDGSAAPFVAMIERAGSVRQQAKRWAMVVTKPLEVRHGDRVVSFEPSPVPRISVEIDFPHTAIGRQSLSVDVIEPVFKRELASARTFGFADQLQTLRQEDLALGGSEGNAVVVDGEAIMNAEGLRFPDEFVRHKVLDIIGDLALAGVTIVGHFKGYKPGHALNQELLGKLIADEHAWTYVMLEELESVVAITELPRALATRVARAWSRMRVVA